MKSLIKILLFVFILLINIPVYGEFIICDSGDINYLGKTIDEICNGGNKNENISLIESFTGNYLNYNTGYWGNNNNHDNFLNIYQNLPIGFFDENKYTKINSVNPEYVNQMGYLGPEKILEKNLDLQGNLSIGFFDENKYTKINSLNPEYVNQIGYLGPEKILEKNLDLQGNLSIGFFDNIISTNLEKNNPEYILPVGFFGNIEKISLLLKSENIDNSGSLNSTGILESSGSLNDLFIINNTGSTNFSKNLNVGNDEEFKITIKDFYTTLFKKYTQGKVTMSDIDYNNFVNNLVNFFLRNYSSSSLNLYISEDKQNRVEEYIQKNSIFEKKMLLLLYNYKELNYVFYNYDDKIKNYYLIYILNN